MNEAELFAPKERFQDEVRWFTRLRFVAAAALAIGVICDATLTDWTATYWWMLALAGAVGGFNLILWFALRIARTDASIVLTCGVQASIDLVALTLLTVWTGGVDSPLMWLFLVYIVLARFSLPPMRGAAYLAALASVVFVGVGLWITGEFPQSGHAVRVIVAWLVATGVITLLSDHLMTLLRQREIRLDQQHSLTQAILDTAVDGIITIDRRGTIVQVNSAAEMIFGYDHDELIGKNVRQLMPSPYHEEHDRFIETYLKTGVATIIGIGRELEGRRRDGNVFPIELAVSETKTSELHLFTGIVRDVTERNAAQQKLKDLNATLVDQREAMIQHEKMVAVGQLAAGVVHEISNPLACMDSVLQLARRNADHEDTELRQTMEVQVERIRKTLSEMSSFVHPNELPFEIVAVNPVVESGLGMVRFDHRIRNVDVTCDLADDVGEARVVPNAIEQVLVNLVLNAVDAVDGADDARITVRTSCSGSDTVQIEVADNGTGIPPENLERVFDPFFTTKPPGKGTGLGLSICYRLITQMGGTIKVASREGDGTRFTLRFPRYTPESGGRENVPKRIPNREKDPGTQGDSGP